MSNSYDSVSKLINNSYNQTIKTPNKNESNLITNKKKFQFKRFSNFNNNRKIIEITTIILAIIFIFYII